MAEVCLNNNLPLLQSDAFRLKYFSLIYVENLDLRLSIPFCPLPSAFFNELQLTSHHIPLPLLPEFYFLSLAF